VFDAGEPAGDLTPFEGRHRYAAPFEYFPVDEMAFKIEVVVDIGVDRGDHLSRLHASEPKHCNLPSSEAQEAVLAPVVAERLTSCLSAFARSFIAALYDARPSVLGFSELP
jgi:hypothetical protein